MRILIIGAVAAGTSAAAKASRNDRSAEIVIYEKDSDISYSACGMPYYLGGEIQDPRELAPRDPAFFKSAYGVDIFTRHEVLAIAPQAKTVTVKNLSTGEEFTDHYDKLVIATGARAYVPSVPGGELPHVFSLRSIGDMRRVQAFMDARRPRTAVVVGAGFAGLEMCESFSNQGLQVTLMAKHPQVAPGLDEDMAIPVREYMEQKGVHVWVNARVARISGDAVILEDGRQAQADMVLLSTGIRPNTEIAAAAGILLGVKNAIRVNAAMETNQPDIYACGDCTEQFHQLTGRPLYRPLGSTANKTGRIAGDCVTGGDMAFRGILDTSIFRVFDMAVAQTGLSQREALHQGYDVVARQGTYPDRPEYMMGRDMVLKVIADRATGRLLGAQAVGFGGVDKRIDVLATAISLGGKVEDLPHLDLAYAPPFSTARDPVAYIGMVLESALRKGGD